MGAITRIFFVLVLFVSFVAMITINALAATGSISFQKTGNISDRHRTFLTPIGTTFSIWSVIYIWLTIIVLYILSLLCRVRSQNEPLAIGLNPVFLILLSTNFILNLTWLFVWDKEYFTAAAIILPVQHIFGQAASALNFSLVQSNGYDLFRFHKFDLWFHRLGIQNGLEVYNTWTLLASLVNLNIALVYDGDMDKEKAATIGLGILSAIIILWFPVENLKVVDKYIRYVFTHYAVILVACLGIYSNRETTGATNLISTWTFVIMIVAAILLALRLILIPVYHIKRPLYVSV